MTTINDRARRAEITAALAAEGRTVDWAAVELMPADVTRRLPKHPTSYEFGVRRSTPAGYISSWAGMTANGLDPETGEPISSSKEQQ